MPSPFPGMDPYLEEPGLWPDVHHRLITVTSELLQDRLSPKYLVRVEERIYTAGRDDETRLQRIRGVHVVSASKRSGGTLKPAEESSVGVLECADPIEVQVELEEAVREARLNILLQDDRSIVAVIEVISPANKTVGAAGRANYLQKRQEVIDSDSHLVEIDLLRAGAWVFARDSMPAHDYAVRVSKRVPESRRAWIWPIRLRQRLPQIFIPLRKEDPDTRLDLQAALATVYKRASYELELDYSKPPVPPLQGDSAAWAAHLPAGAGA